MQLKILAAAISARQIIGPLDRVVEGIAYDSRRVQRNFLFVALRGEKSDGHQFIEQAIEKGASVIVTEQEVQQARATCIVVENTRHALADLGGGFLRTADAPAQDGRRSPGPTARPPPRSCSNTFARKRAALRPARDRSLRNRRSRSARRRARRRSRSMCRSCSRRWRTRDARPRRWKFPPTRSRRSGRAASNWTSPSSPT